MHEYKKWDISSIMTVASTEDQNNVRTPNTRPHLDMTRQVQKSYIRSAGGRGDIAQTRSHDCRRDGNQALGRAAIIESKLSRADAAMVREFNTSSKVSSSGSGAGIPAPTNWRNRPWSGPLGSNSQMRRCLRGPEGG